ncbi:acyltransferase family protein [Nocardioides bruguierae]|uniref:acyltransferase family protein n=1 Tax=Nocardioides bruguierae TaxID=2945102 RepID=UPI002020C51B|nr:acyltransferase family protein [Nocardioides bruguierae]MCL8026230.1 acyltransferase [Nocardioides bruguierae]
MAEESARPSLFTGLRRDIQGVRGLGVSLVVLGHLTAWPPGVFAALDIFFVLSGYLITTILLTQLPKYGARMLPVFYLGRVRRLFPMALLVLALTVLATWWLYSGVRAGDVLTDATWAAFFAVNWHFAADGTDYFSPQSESPLLHYWSLSVEEQFYVFWPALVLLGIALGALALRRRQKRQDAGSAAASALEPATENRLRGGWPTLLVLGALTLGTFAFSLWHSAANPTTAYFNTFDRAWEFGAGGILAVVAPMVVTWPRRLRHALAWVGLVGVLTVIFLIQSTVQFPAPWGLVPVAASLLLITGGLDGHTRFIWALDNPVMRYLGDISYSIYLWHMPLIVLGEPFFAGHEWAFYVVVPVATLVLASGSYHLVERPLRNARFWMTAAEKRRKPPRDPRPLGEKVRGAIGGGGLAGQARGFAMVGTAVVAIMVAASVLRGPAAEDAAGAADLADADLQASMLSSLEEDGFPDFDPSLAYLRSTDWESEQASYGCGETPVDDLSSCLFNSTGKKDQPVVAVYGDSVAASWMPTVRTAFEAEGWAVQQLTLQQCGPWELKSYVKQDGEAYPECGQLHDAVHDWLDENTPDVLIMASSMDQASNADRAEIGGTHRSLSQSALAAALRLVPTDTQVVVLGSPPNHQYLVDCVTRVGTPVQCATTPNQLYRDHRAGEEAAAEAAGAAYVDTQSWFCVQGQCPGFVGDVPVTVDGVHLTIQYAERLAPLLTDALRPLAAALEDDVDAAEGLASASSSPSSAGSAS